MKLALLSIFLAIPLFSQTAKVIQLTPDEAKEAKSLYEQKAAIEAQVVNLHQKIITKYSLDNKNSMFPAYDFEYSTDYRFVVPKIPVMSPATSCCLPTFNWVSTCGYLGPVVGMAYTTTNTSESVYLNK
jgi:hypothetical protein